MVFFGLPLPAKNLNVRMENLKIALENDAIKNFTNATIINRNSIPVVPIQVPVQVPTGNLINLDFPLGPKTRPQNPIQAMNASRNKMIDLLELKSKLGSLNKGLKPSPSPYSENLKNAIQQLGKMKKVDDPALVNSISKLTAVEMESLTNPDSLDALINDQKIKLDNDKKKVILYIKNVLPEILSKVSSISTVNRFTSPSSQRATMETSTSFTDYPYSTNLKNAIQQLGQMKKIENPFPIVKAVVDDMVSEIENSDAISRVSKNFVDNIIGNVVRSNAVINEIKNNTKEINLPEISPMVKFILDDIVKRVDIANNIDANTKNIVKSMSIKNLLKLDKYLLMLGQKRASQTTRPTGEGLVKVKGKSYLNQAPNFGNLYVNEGALKRGNLSVKRPYSNIIEISVKNISPLLKKMVIDIANTLEFDKKDYYNLDSSEKRVIERIIAKQKNMKNMNIEMLIDSDTQKIRKRLEVLMGEVNSGNNSSELLQEIKELLKKLYNNGNISHFKYNSILKNIRTLE